MVSSPARTTPGSLSGAVSAFLPLARRSRASTSAGPALSSSTSSTPHSAVSATRPPSVSTTNSGAATPVVRSRRHSERAPARSLRASTSTASDCGAVSSADTSAGATRTEWPSRASAGSTSEDGVIALVSSNKVAIGGCLL